ncbi:hypothetical protein H2509_19215 [Stappia sp. F7233]|uniref:Uncharacterized protein n=1 Tax=Stappia albiluteola TaxID=2758565 RepID=A0A839AJE6_9HYPH|nr:hypothetical protein [Stappia albiluteola]MBA5779265.1 hypothetical protein [Stappia albiluteola]
MLPPRLSQALLATVLLILPAVTAEQAMATPVKTERIQVAPPEEDAPLVPEIPADAIETEIAPPSTERHAPVVDESAPPPVVHYGDADLPKPVARMRDQMLEAAYSGDIERMRLVLEANEVMPTLTFGDMDDPIEFLKESSGDPDGYEILAILTELLEAGWVHVDVGTAQEMYVWPYFARYPFAKLTPQQKVEMYRIVTAGDFAEMESYGAWIFYRIGIGPDGTLHYFVAGD